IDRGGAQGTLRGVNLALWESDGLTELACNRYVRINDDVVVGYTNLTIGNWYYISVDNYYSGYRGTFTLCIDDAVDYDYYEGAIELTNITNWCSADAAYTTVGATPDKNAASCWNTGPNYNRWFKFQASATEKITFTVLRGGNFGNLRGVNVALWESDGITEVSCNRYVGINDNVTIQTTGLNESNWYYISVDNYYSGYRGSFTLCLDDERMRWNGNVDTDWAEPGNWSYAYVPTFSDDILVPSGLTNYPETNTDTDAEAKSLLMEPGTRLTIPGGKTLSVTNKMELKSDASGMSSLLDQGTLNYDAAKTSYECYLSEDQWHLVSAPVSNAKSAVYLGIYLKYFTEPDSSWHYISALNHDLNVGQGFAAWAASWITGATTVTYNGSFNTGNQSPAGLSYNVGLGAGDGWNLVGNPFPSAVEWNNNWPTNNIDATIYVYDGISGQYLDWNRTLSDGTMPNGDIPPAQGFWVKANESSPSMTIPHSERKHSSQGFYKSGFDNVIRIKVSGNGYSDKLLVYFHDAATEEFDSEYDAYKLRGIIEAPQIYTVSAGIDLTLNTLPPQSEINLPMGFEAGAEGVYTLKAENLNIMTNANKVFLEDKQENKIVELNKIPVYEFYALQNDEPDRFNIHIIMKKSDQDTLKSSGKDNIHIYSANSDVFIHLPEVINSHIFVYDLMGQLIKEQKGESNTLNIIRLNTNSGIYIIKVIDNKEIFSKKVFIK
ncbi:MAG: T9SS type A sorting domain-containing protein, partial [Bacteroidales bacterium]|nr:T9SS type A sorting domain-containing protein [Bacteroidales bacterium]